MRYYFLLLLLSCSAGTCTSASPPSFSFSSRHDAHRRWLQAIPGIPNDIYHCNHRQDSRWLDDDDAVDCNTDTDYKWDIGKLDPNEPPKRCEDFDYESYVPNDNREDYWNSSYEPCLLWEILYGALQPTTAPSDSSGEPSASPSDSVVPTEVPTIVPTESPAPSAVPTTAPSPIITAAPTVHPNHNDDDDKRSMTFSNFSLRLVVPSTNQQRRRRRRYLRGDSSSRTLQQDDTTSTSTSLLSLDLQEWHQITSSHLQKYLSSSTTTTTTLLFSHLDLQFVSDSVVAIDKQLGVATVTQEMGGTVYYYYHDDEDRISSITPPFSTTTLVDTLIRNALTRTPMKFEYLLLLQSAQDPILANTQKVEYQQQNTTTTDFGEGASPTDQWFHKTWNYFSTMNTSDVVLVASIGALLVAALLVLLVWCRLRKRRIAARRNNNDNLFVMDDDLKKTDTAETETAEKNRSPESIVQNNDASSRDDDDDDDSVATSTYSYIEDGSSIMSYPQYTTTTTTGINQQFSYDDDDDEGSLRFCIPDSYNNDMSLDTIHSDITMSNMITTSDINDSTSTIASNKDATKTSNVRELFGSGVLGGDQEEIPPPRIRNGTSLLPEEEGEDHDSATTSSSYDGHLALTNYYGDKNSYTASDGGGDGSLDESADRGGGVDGQASLSVVTNTTTNNNDSEKEDKPNETMDDDDDDEVSTAEHCVVDPKEVSQYDEESSRRSAVSEATSSSNKKENGGGGDLGVSHVESPGKDKTEGREQDDSSD